MENTLLEAVEEAFSPAQKFLALKALCEYYESNQDWEQKLAILKECLEISNGDDSLWREMGDCALKLKQVSLSKYCFEAASILQKTPENLSKLAIAQALTYDYTNALTISNYLIENHSESSDLRNYIRNRLSGIGDLSQFSDFFSIKPEQHLMNNKIDISAHNSYSLIKNLNKNISNERLDLLVNLVAKGPQGIKNRLPPKVIENPGFLENIKRAVYAKTQGFRPSRIVYDRYEPPRSLKVNCKMEQEIENLIGIPWTMKNLVVKVFELAKNTPRPSPVLSGETSAELLGLYAKTYMWIELQDEVLTLLEISNTYTLGFNVIEILQNTTKKHAHLYEEHSLKIRAYAALAYSKFKIRSMHEKSSEAFLECLKTVEKYARLCLDLIGNHTVYMWWSSSLLNKRNLERFLENLKVEFQLVSIEKSIKVHSASIEGSIKLMSYLANILYKHYKQDSPIYYWRKFKKILLNHKIQNFSGPQKAQLFEVFSVYMSVLLYNVETGNKLSKNHELKKVSENICSLIGPFLDKYTVTDMATSYLNLCPHSTELMNTLPDFVFALFQEIDPTSLPQLFKELHDSIPTVDSNAYHSKLCKIFEVVLFESKSEWLTIAYQWIYMIDSNFSCSCKLSPHKSNIFIPNSPDKLFRFLKFTEIAEEKFELRYSLEVKPSIHNILKKLHSNEKSFFLHCNTHKNYIENVDNMIQSGSLQDIHEGCCDTYIRKIARKAYLRLGSYYLSKKDTSSAMIDILKCALDLKLSSKYSLLLLGYSYMWSWILKVFDHKHKSTEGSDDQALQALKIFEICGTPPAREASLFLRFLISYYDKSVLGIECKPSSEYENILYGLILLRRGRSDFIKFIKDDGLQAIHTLKCHKKQVFSELVNNDCYLMYLNFKIDENLQELICRKEFLAADVKFLPEIIGKRDYIIWYYKMKPVKQLLKIHNRDVYFYENLTEYLNRIYKNYPKCPQILEIYKMLVTELCSKGEHEKAKELCNKHKVLSAKDKKQLISTNPS